MFLRISIISFVLKFLSLFFVIYWCYFLVARANSVNASSFKHSFNAVYEIDDNGHTNVMYSIKTFNNTDTDFLKSIRLELPFKVDGDINSYNSHTPIVVNKYQEDNSLNLLYLDIDFLDPVIGKDNSMEWSLSFQISNIIKEHGSQKVVIIPKFLVDNVDLDNSIKVKLPKKIGKVSYVYGGKLDESDQNFYTITSEYSSIYDHEDSGGKSLIVLIGDKAFYQMSIKNSGNNEKLLLPMDNPYQKAFYTDNFFDKTSSVVINYDEWHINLGKYFSQTSDLKTAYIVSQLGYDRIRQPNGNRFVCSRDLILDSKIITFLDSLKSEENLDLYAKSKKVYIYLSRFRVQDFGNIYEGDFNKIANPTSVELNAFELNFLYRYMLCLLGINTRLSYGYVFPVQPLIGYTDDAYQHSWVEIWDGSRWILADPSWYLSSKDIYFDNNNFIHIKFFHLYEASNDLIDVFRQQYGKLSVKALSSLPAEAVREFNFNDLEFSIDPILKDRRSYRVRLRNSSNQFVFVNNINFDCYICYKFQSSLNSSDIVVLNPFSEFSFYLEEKYFSLILFNENVNLRLEIDYSTDHQNFRKHETSSKVTYFQNATVINLIFANLVSTLIGLFYILFFVFKKFDFQDTKI